MKVTSSLACSLLLFSVALNGLAQQASQSPRSSEASGTSQDLPTEIVVTPTISLRDLGKLIIEAEEDLFAKFNELNDDDKYNIECLTYRRTGTHIPSRFCVPNFLVAARAENAGDVAFSFWTDPFGSPFLLSDRALVNETSKEYEVLQDKMEEFAKENIEFREAAINLILLQRTIKQRRGEK